MAVITNFNCKVVMRFKLIKLNVAYISVRPKQRAGYVSTSMQLFDQLFLSQNVLDTCNVFLISNTM